MTSIMAGILIIMAGVALLLLSYILDSLTKPMTDKEIIASINKRAKRKKWQLWRSK